MVFSWGYHFGDMYPSGCQDTKIPLIITLVPTKKDLSPVEASS
jgi:hypothetical protein